MLDGIERLLRRAEKDGLKERFLDERDRLADALCVSLTQVERDILRAVSRPTLISMWDALKGLTGPLRDPRQIAPLPRDVRTRGIRPD